MSDRQENAINRRDFLHSTSALTAATLLSGCTARKPAQAQATMLPFYDAVPPLVPIRANPNALFKITVCLRPFRAVGPRIEAEQIGTKRVVHNYGHGGSGWSLSWGSGAVATRLALEGTDPATQDIAVIGCGALGLTAATLLQRAGCRSVTIYAKDRTSDARSFRATGSWTPDSRIALTKSIAGTDFGTRWEAMARTSWREYQRYLGLAGAPIEFTDRYFLSDPTPDHAEQQRRDEDPIGFAHLNDRIADIRQPYLDLPPGSHPFPTRYARRSSQLMFNVTELSHGLQNDFLIAGGKIVTREFHSPADLQDLPQSTIVNCTGYGARALFGDDSLVPVRGQIGWLLPQHDVNYGFVYGNLNVLARPDGIVVQLSEQGEASGFNNADETPDRREAELGVTMLRDLYERMQPTHRG
jgi:glycine/D-amino acid oxidase-like deaminating enzyme